MDVNLKVTDQPQESSFYDLLAGDSVLSIPLFQRPYRWGQKNFDWLYDDVMDVKNGVTQSCFLGVVVCVSRGAIPGRPIPWEIVDGQQRLSTLYLFLLAAVEVAAEKREFGWASGVLGTYLLVRPLASNPVNTKLVPSFADRGQFKAIWDGIAQTPGFMEEPTVAANVPRPPAPAGLNTGAMHKQYGRIRARLRKVWQAGGKEALERLVAIAANSLSVVSISLRDPLAAPKIFERLNNRAELVTTADLVRNEVFARASNDPAQAQHVFSNIWEPFVGRFATARTELEKFLFPYGLILDRSLTKAELFTCIRKHWASLAGPAAVIADMDLYVAAFLSLEAGVDDVSLPAELRLRLGRIHRIGRPSSTFAFIIRLVVEVQAGRVAASEAAAILDVLESFLFRRAIGGIEPTGLHAVFKGLWTDIIDESGISAMTAANVRLKIASKPTIAWPSDNEFAISVRVGNLYARKVCQYALREFEVSADGESPSDDFQVEHVLPQSSTPAWDAVFGERYQELVHTWANLVPLTGRMNIGAGQEGFAVKRSEYENSIFATTRAIADEFRTWTPVDVDQRAAVLSAWAVTRWPY